MLGRQLREDSMSDETTPNHPESAPEESPLEVAENLADSDDPEVLRARTELLKAQTSLTKASIPLFEKIVLRGVIPIALAVIGPWALWKFDKAEVEQKRQGEIIVQLQGLLKDAQKESEARKQRSTAWRERMSKIEEERAAELAAMTAMVVRLDGLLKLVLVRDAVSRSLAPGANGGIADKPTRADVIRDAKKQLPDLAEDDVQRLAGEQFDRIMEQRKKK